MTATPATDAPLDGATRELAAFAAHLDYHALPPEVVSKAKACILDTLGCMVFGATLPWTRLVAEVARAEGGNPQASIIGSRERTSVSQAAWINSTAGHAFELDDAHTGASLHAGAIALAAALAVAEYRGKVSGQAFIAGLIAGYEAGLRVGIASNGQLFKRGFHAAAVCGVFVAAATAANLLRLNAQQAQHAFGVAGSLASGLMAAQEGAMVKRLHAGQAARNGVLAALLAQRGFTGIVNVLEAPFGGFFSTMTERHDPAALTAGLGTVWETLAVGFKPYATAGASQPALALLDAIMREHGLAADDIKTLEVECTSHCKAHVAWTYVPQGVASAQLNLYYALAAMAVERAAMAEQFSEAKLADARLLGFMPRIALRTDPAFDAMGNRFRYATRVLLTTTSGQRHVRETLHRPGSPAAPLTAEQLNDKFESLASHGLDADQRAAVRAQVDNLEQLAVIDPLLASLRT